MAHLVVTFRPFESRNVLLNKAAVPLLAVRAPLNNSALDTLAVCLGLLTPALQYRQLCCASLNGLAKLASSVPLQKEAKTSLQASSG